MDSRSLLNDRFMIKDKEGNVVAEIAYLGLASANLEVITADGLYIEKPNGWTSLNNNSQQATKLCSNCRDI